MWFEYSIGAETLFRVHICLYSLNILCFFALSRYYVFVYSKQSSDNCKIFAVKSLVFIVARCTGQIRSKHNLTDYHWHLIHYNSSILLKMKSTSPIINQYTTLIEIYFLPRYADKKA